MTVVTVVIRIYTNVDMVSTTSVDPIDVYFPTSRSRSMEEYDKQVHLEHSTIFKSSVLRSPRLKL